SFIATWNNLTTYNNFQIVSWATNSVIYSVGGVLLSLVASIPAGYALAAYQVLAGGISLGDLVMIYQAFQRGMAAIQDVSGALAGLYDDSLFLSNYHEFLELRPRVTAPETPVPVPRPFREALALDNVSFAYPGSDRRVLDGVSLALRPGEVIALVGENGAGKTTLVKLVCRLYDPTAGAVTLDGIDLRRFRPEALRREIGVIFQDFARYALTARENIRLGDHELAPDDPRLAAAVRQAGAEPVIRRLPDGLDTLLGCQFAGGTELSAGQWQRIALARAFLRDSRIVVLDEPTSSLDPVAEYELFATFRRLLEGRAAILISHRFSTVRMADTIHVLAGGRIVESGSHESLMAAGGHYARMFMLQSANYR
ncbi:MAG TPA: ABC transporter ATP-binding protein, partial [Acidobacteriota bacterium]|nr:ABC transporter ATP-binding protein [Acidobacteriota bacterium]